jgi:hypothetical protein
MIKKMALVDLKTLESLREKQQQPKQQPSPPLTPGEEARAKLSELDAQLQDVLNQRGLSDEEKFVQYSTVLDRFNRVRKAAIDTPLNVRVHPSNIINQIQEQNIPLTIEKSIIDSVPVSYQNRAKSLIGRIKDIDNLSVNRRGELLVDGSAVNGANIVDLVGDLLRKKKDFNPAGWEEFSKLLIRENIPETLVGNKDRLRFMQQIKQRNQGIEQQIESLEEQQNYQDILPFADDNTDSEKNAENVQDGSGVKRKRKSVTNQIGKLKWVKY